MTQLIVNVGATANDHQGDSLRSSFQKININFTELYAREANTDIQTLSLIGDTLSISGGNSVTITRPTDYQGSVFSDNSTLMVDGISAKINLDQTFDSMYKRISFSASCSTT